MPDKPDQETPKGFKLPTPTRDEVFDALRKVAKAKPAKDDKSDQSNSSSS